MEQIVLKTAQQIDEIASFQPFFNSIFSVDF
jgi:hypothetical protein